LSRVSCTEVVGKSGSILQDIDDCAHDDLFEIASG
jgi:hypothetical protein